VKQDLGDLQSDTEKKLARIWAELLKVDISQIGRHSSFFALGGDSISAVQLVNKIRKVFSDAISKTFDMKAVYREPILKTMALRFESAVVEPRLLEHSQWDTPRTPERPRKPEPPKTPTSRPFVFRTTTNRPETPRKPEPPRRPEPARQKPFVQRVIQNMSSFDSMISDESDWDTFKYTKKSVRPEFKKSHLKIVCLHGQGTSAQIFSSQLSEVMKTLGSTAEFLFLEAGNEWKGKSELKDVYDSKWYEWWPSVFITKKTVKKSFESVVDKLYEIGPIDAILGFSQGASLVELLDRRAHEGSIQKTWNFSVLLSPVPLKSITLPKSYNHGVKGGLPGPALMVRGVKERNFIGNAMLDRYDVNSQELIEHPKGHEIPLNAEFTKRFAEKILRMAYNQRKNASKSRPQDIVTSIVSYS
jgi:acyl carrier protein